MKSRISRGLQSPQIVPRVILGLIIISYLALAVWYNALQPIGEAPDEPAHVEYIRFVQQQGRLPAGDPNAPPHLDPLAPGIEFDQVPLYYLIEALVLRPVWLPPGTFLHRNPYIGWPGHPWRDGVDLHWTDEGWPYQKFSLFIHGGRLLSTAFGLISILASFGLIRCLMHRSAPALFAAAWIAWNPSFLQSSSHVNNDAAVVAFSALTLFCCGRMIARGKTSRLELIILSLSLTAAIMSKLHGILFTPLAFVAVALASGDVPLTWRDLTGGRDLIRRVRPAIAVLGLPAFALGLWWLVVGHTFAARLNVTAGVGVARLAGPSEPVSLTRILEAIAWMNNTLWSGYGAGGSLPWPAPLYLALAIPPVALVLSGIFAITRGSSRAFTRSRGATHSPSVAAAGGTPPGSLGFAGDRWAATLLGLASLPFFYATITRQAFPWVGLDANARFIQPVFPVIALALVLGGRYVIPTQFRRPLAVVYLAVILTVSVAQAAFLFPRITVIEIPARLARTPAEATQPPLASFANGVDLLDPVGLPEALAPGTPLTLTLRWHTDHTPAANFITYAHVIDQSTHQRVSASDDRIPFEKEFPPVLWQHGEIVDQTENLAIPAGLAPGVYNLEAGIYQGQGEHIQRIPRREEGKEDNVVLRRWVILPDVSDERTARPCSARFGTDLRLVAFRLQPVETGIQTVLYWTTDRPLRRNLTVSVQLLDAAGKPLAQQDSEPVAGRLPMSDWPTSAVIRDERLIPVKEVPEGTRVAVVVYDRQTMERLSVQNGTAASLDFLDLGGVSTPAPTSGVRVQGSSK